MTASNPDGPPQAPSEADAVAALRTVFGDRLAEAAWAAALQSAGLRSPVQETDQLLLTCRQLTDISEAMRVTSRSLRIRLIAYNAMMGGTGA